MPHDPVNDAQQLIAEGHSSLFDVLPTVIKKIIRDEVWVGRAKGPMDDGRPFKSFEEFVEYQLWWGLECPYDRLMRFCEHDPECLEMLKAERTKAATIAKRAKKATELRDQGMTQQRIAEQLGVDRSVVSRDLCKSEVITTKLHKPKRKVTGYRTPNTPNPARQPKRSAQCLVMSSPCSSRRRCSA